MVSRSIDSTEGDEYESDKVEVRRNGYRRKKEMADQFQLELGSKSGRLHRNGSTELAYLSSSLIFNRIM